MDCLSIFVNFTSEDFVITHIIMITIIMNGTKSNVRRGLMTSDSCSSPQDGRLPVVLDTHLTLPLQIQIQIQMKMIKGQDIQLIRYVVSGGFCQVCSKSLRQIIRFCWIQEFRFTTSRFQLVLVTRCILPHKPLLRLTSLFQIGIALRIPCVSLFTMWSQQ